MMTILFYLKPYWYSFPPSAEPIDAGAKKERKTARKILEETEKARRKRRQREEQDMFTILEAMLDDD